MSKHTQGPWFLKRSGVIADRATGELVATTGYRVVAGSIEDDANAALIAAAPELLEMVVRLIDQGERCNWFGDRLDEALAQEARDLIAKAGG